MSLHLMRERIKISGSSPREEMIRDGQNVLNEELEHDISYSPTVYFYDPVKQTDSRPARLRIFNRKYSSLNGNYENFLTVYNNPIKIGEYIHDTKDDTYWLVYNSFNVNDTHYEGKLIQCNYLLKWQLSNGTIVERYSNIVSASKYDIGESGNNVMMLSSNNYTVLIGYCEEGFELEGKRVFIDLKSKNPTKVFKMTRNDDVIYNSDGIGKILGFIADKTEFDPSTDNQELLICDYHPPTLLSKPNETTDLYAAIIGEPHLKLGFPRTYTVSFTDKQEKNISWEDVNFSWNVVSDFEIKQTVNGNKIKLFVEDEELNDEKFKLQIIINDQVSAELIISITELM